jgi:hypothetical protein
MWCPQCRGEFREEIHRCPTCNVDLVGQEPDPDYSLSTGPLTGRPIEEEIRSMGPTVAGTFVTMDEAQAALRALSDAGILADVVNRDEQLPMTINKAEPSMAVAVAAPDLSRARAILRNTGLLPTAVARYRREEDAHQALSLLESRGLRPRVSKIVMDDLPREFQADMEPFVLEVPADQEIAANRALEGTMMKICDNCGGQIYFGDGACKGCGERVTVL